MFVILNLFQLISFGQNKKCDSLISLIQKDKEDTNKINHLKELGWELKYINPDTVILIGNQSLQLAKKINWKKGIAISLGNLGLYNHIKLNYPNALGYYLKATVRSRS